MASPFLFADNARSTLAANLSVGGTTITLATGGGALFPNPGPNQQFALTLNDVATQGFFEVVWCTARAGDILTVLRGQEGTTPRAWTTGDYVWNGPTAAQMNNMVQQPHMVDASIAPIFSNTIVQGTFTASGPATFGATGTFAGPVTGTDPAGGGGVIVNSTASAPASLRLNGNSNNNSTPIKYIRAVNGSLDIVSSDYTREILTLTDQGDLGAIRNLNAAGSAAFGGSVFAASTGSFVDTAGLGGVLITGSGVNGAGLALHGNGTVTPNKWLRAQGGHLQVVNSGYTGIPFDLDDLGNLQIAGSFGAQGNIVTGAGTVLAPYINSTGDILANHRLRAGVGAFASGDPGAATILYDYVTVEQGNDAYFYVRLPNGVVIQTNRGGTTTGNGDVITFPNAFPTACVQVLVHEAEPSGWNQNGTLTPTIFASKSLSNVSFALYCIRQNQGAPTWFYAPGIAYRYIAIGY
jgi:hypothetical protein